MTSRLHREGRVFKSLWAHTTSKEGNYASLNKKRKTKDLLGLHKAVNEKNFVDSFKGVFVEKKFDIDLKQVKKISELRLKGL